MDKQFFGTDGIRGKVGAYPVTAELVLKLGWAAGRVLGSEGCNAVVIGKDTRLSGYMFESALEAGFSAAGVDIKLLGPMPTPAIAYLTRTLYACAGVVISASHNPHHDNGIKFFSAEGSKLDDALELAIEAELAKPFQTVESAHLGKAERVIDAAGRYIEYCKSTVRPGARLEGLRLVVDCANGATYQVAPSVFRELGAEIVAIGAQPNGLNINDGCGSTVPETVQSAVRDNGADIGVALDGDGDRVIMVDEVGEILDGDELLYIIARARHRAGELRGAVVGTVMTNLGLEHALEAEGIGLERVKVGDRHILERLIARDWVLGGETSGHIICRDRMSTGDGIISALQVLSEVVHSGLSLHELKRGMTKYPQTLINVPAARGAELDAAPVRDAVRAAE
nr:phosphoglucosamine mutase [Gammaproteobacteria bacterium]